MVVGLPYDYTKSVRPARRRKPGTVTGFRALFAGNPVTVPGFAPRDTPPVRVPQTASTRTCHARLPPRDHSWRKAAIGSIRAARTAGGSTATTPTATTTAAASANVHGSSGAMPYKIGR